MNTVGPLLTQAGAGLKAYGAIQAGNAESADLSRQAETTLQQTYADEEQQRRQARQLLGEQAASAAEAGGGYGGTLAKVLEDSHKAAQLDALTFRYRGQMKAYGLRTEARNAKIAGYSSAASSLLDAVGSTYLMKKQQSAAVRAPATEVT